MQAGRRNRFFYSFLMATLTIVILMIPSLLRAQSQPDPPSYWQYAASGQIKHVLENDIDLDGVGDFIIADENGRVEMVDSTGIPVWRYLAPAEILSIAVLNVQGSHDSPLEVLIGIPNQLILLSSNGEVIWRTTTAPGSVTPLVLPSGPQESAGEGADNPEFLPAQILPFDENNDGQSEILVILQSGTLLIYDNQGEIIWQETNYSYNPKNLPPNILVFDFEGDGQDEILFSVFNPRRFGQLIMVDEGQVAWEIPVSGRITNLAKITKAGEQSPLIAVSTSLGHLQIFDHLRQQRWLRTLNQPISSLTSFSTADGNALAAGTSTGTVAVFDEDGRRLWDNHLDPDASRQILSISAIDGVVPPGQPSFAVTMESALPTSNAAELILVGRNGQLMTKISNVDPLGLSRFVDSNNDQINELLVGHFATIELIGLGVGNNENVREWEYTLNAVPSALLVTDFEADENDEIVIGTADGRIHSLNNDRSIRWLHDVGGTITHLAALPQQTGNENSIVVVRQGNEADNGDESAWIELREAKGERIWETKLNSPINALIVQNIDQTPDYEIVAGMEDGRLLVFDSNGELKSERLLHELAGPVRDLVFIGHENNFINELIISGDKILIGLNLQDDINPVRQIASFDSPILDFYPLASKFKEELSTSLIVNTADQTIHGLNWRGIEMAQWSWPKPINGVPVTSTRYESTDFFETEDRSLLIGTDSGYLIQLDVLDNQPVIPWQRDGIGRITALHWRDQDGDGSPDLSFAGTANGEVWISSLETHPIQEMPATLLELSSSVFALDSIQRANNQSPDLMTISDNGIVQLYREQENRPPFLTKPVAEVNQGQYSISVEVNDVEQDDVFVQLEILNPESGQWLPMDAQKVINGSGTLFWTPTSIIPGDGGLQYRFVFNDGSNHGQLTPAPGPLLIAATPLTNVLPVVVVGVGLTGLVLSILFIHQSQTMPAQARRFYRRLQKQPTKTLLLLENKYQQTQESSDFLLHLANQAGQSADELISNLAQGLFLLEDRPQSGLSILVNVLEEISDWRDGNWEGLQRWLLSFQTSLAFLEAPSITEISLLRPQLIQLLKLEEYKNISHTPFQYLKPILTNIRDSERVDLVEDRLVYLNSAAALCKQVKEKLPEERKTIEYSIVSSVIKRWTGVINAEIEDLRGRAQLTVSLKTKRLVPLQHTFVAIEVGNKGRSAAENVVIILDNDPAYIIHSEPEEIPILPSGRSMEVRFKIEPKVIDRFRLGITITFNDRNRKDKIFAFGDMVHLLPPTREFSPLPNPYTPGTPLRPDSLLFFGREDLFGFIAENAGYRSFRNVLILVGQRRTGKTSALLRLEDHLPPHLLPVYIDCQSLGVIAGMPALLEEFAWTIADAMSRRGYQVEVPELDQWQKDPTRLFQRRFLPKVISLLPEETTLLLVFDEFEAFENLVADGILPPTFFTYLRHLMQHGQQLNFIFVGTRRLEEMSSDYWSVLFNIALYRKIDFLTTTAATRLITEPVAPYLIYDDLAIDKILRVTAGHPYFLQLVCYTLVKHANGNKNGYVTISDVNAAIDEMLSLGEVHFAYLWQRSSDTERALLIAVAHLMDPNAPFYPEDLLDYLEPYYTQPDPMEVTRALNKLVERDVLREVTEETRTLYELRLGLVGSWVARNKSLSKLLAGNGAKRPEITFDEPTK